MTKIGPKELGLAAMRAARLSRGDRKRPATPIKPAKAPAEAPPKETETVKNPTKKPKSKSPRKPAGKPKGKRKPVRAPQVAKKPVPATTGAGGSQRDALKAFLQQPGGKTCKEIVAHFGMLPHSARAAVSRIEGVTKVKSAERGTVYSLAAPPTDAPAA